MKAVGKSMRILSWDSTYDGVRRRVLGDLVQHIKDQTYYKVMSDWWFVPMAIRSTLEGERSGR